MSARRLLLASMLIIIALVAATSASAGGTGRKMVVFRPGVGAAAQDAEVREAGGRPLKPVRLVNATVADLTAGEAQALLLRPDVLRVDDDAVVEISADPGQPVVAASSGQSSQAPGKARKTTPTPTPTISPSPTATSTLPPAPMPTATSGPTSTPAPVPSPTPSSSPQVIPWGISKVSAPQSWPTTWGSPAKVGIIDTGISQSHPDLAIAGGVCEVSYTTSYNDDNGHGSHVSGIVAALNNSIGVEGVAPSASLYAIKALDSGGSGYLSDIINGLDWAMANGIQVVNMSLGTASDVQSFHDAITSAYNAGIVLVAAAGNSGPASYTVTYPAAYSEVIAVSAIDSSGAIASFSSNGPQVDLAAPGVDVYSTYSGTGYATLSGTSMASPHVAGVAALRKSLHPSESPAQVAAVLESNADLLTGLTSYQQGSGLVDAYRVVTAP